MKKSNILMSIVIVLSIIVIVVIICGVVFVAVTLDKMNTLTFVNRDEQKQNTLTSIVESGIDESSINNILSDEIQPSNPTNSSDFILPFSDTQILKDEDLNNLSKEQLRIARNEIYARYGRQFKDDELQSYFNTKKWYVDLPKLAMGDEPTLIELEKTNVDLILLYEESNQNLNQNVSETNNYVKTETMIDVSDVVSVTNSYSLNDDFLNYGEIVGVKNRTNDFVNSDKRQFYEPYQVNTTNLILYDSVLTTVAGFEGGLGMYGDENYIPAKDVIDGIKHLKYSKKDGDKTISITVLCERKTGLSIILDIED